jgi:ABC-2 type transport system permease protein
MAPEYRAIIVKEFKVFARDMTQAIQLLLLLGLCMVYLYNFRILHGVANLPDATKLWWQGFLVGSNLAMGAFVMTAVCTRFVFPSVSLEGQSYWILQTSPLSVGQLLRAKFWCWLVPVASMSSIIFASGALAINAEPEIIAINALASWVVCYGIVGLATGLGALFSNFDWEHSSQLAASFGSLVFMLSATVLIVLNLIPAGTLIFLRTLKETGYNFTDSEWYLAVGCCAILLTYLNYCATRWALRVGEHSLLNRS